jgi:hypothetical protein
MQQMKSDLGEPSWLMSLTDLSEASCLISLSVQFQLVDELELGEAN